MNVLEKVSAVTMDVFATTIANGVTCWNPVRITCVDCGVYTRQFCDGDEVYGADGRWRGTPCLAINRVGRVNALGELIPEGQRTPLCFECCARAFRQHGLEKCHYCRGVAWATPPPE